MQNIAENMSLYSDDFNHYDAYSNKEFKALNTLNELEENENLKPALNVLNALDENQKHIDEKEEQILELASPKEKQDFLKNTLENSRSNEKIAESLDILDALDENAKLIKEKEEQIKQTQKSLENKNSLDKTIDDKADEAYNKQIDELLKQHENELARLKEERENLEQNFDKSIENLLNSKDLGDVLKALQEMDRAFSLMLKQAYEEGCALKKQREEKIELAVKSGAMKELAKDLVKEIHSKTKELEESKKIMQKEQNAYLELDRLTKKDLNDIKKLNQLEKFYEKTNKELPNFKENYPKTYAKGQKMLEKGKSQVINQTLGQTHFKEQARTMV